MKASDSFTEIIASHLQSVADKDPLFAETYKKPNKNIDDCINYILHTVKATGRSGFADAEIYGMAVHYYDEDDIKPTSKVSGKVVVNHSVPAAPSTSTGSSAPIVAKPKAKKQQSPVENQPSLF